MMVKFVWRWIGCALLALSLTGCWESTDLDNIVYIHGVGIDYVHGQYEVWLGLIDPRKSGTQQTPSGEGTSSPLWVVHGRGKSFLEAVNAIYPTSPKRISWSHFSLLILQENLLRGPYMEAISALTRYREIRYTIWVYGTKDSLKKMFSAQLPVENNPLYYYVANPKRVQPLGYVVPPVRLSEWIRALHEPVGSALLPQISINKSGAVQWVGAGNKSFDELVSTCDGVFDGERFAGWLSHRDMLGLFWGRIGGTRIPLFLSMSQGSPARDLLYTHHFRVDIKPLCIRNHWTYSMKISGPVDLAQANLGDSENKILKAAQFAVASDIRRTFTEGVMRGVDVFNLTAKVYRGKWILWPLHAKQRLLRDLTLQTNFLRVIQVELTLSNTAMRMLD